MPRTAITPQVIPAGQELVNPTYTAMDATNNMSFVNTGKEYLVIKNTHVSSQDIDLISVADVHGRTDDRTLSVPQDQEVHMGPFNPGLWNQSDGVVHIDLTDDTLLTIAVLKYAPQG